MNNTTTTSPTADFIHMAYHQVPCLSFLVAAKVDNFDECLHAIGGYNNFDPAAVSRVITDHLGDLMSIEIGRSSSPAIELVPAYWNRQRFQAADKFSSERISDEDRTAAIWSLIGSLFKAEADAVSVMINGEFHFIVAGQELPAGTVSRVRAWWD